MPNWKFASGPSQPIVLRGWAKRYDELSCGPLTFEDDRLGYFARGSHSAMMEADPDIHLIYGSHNVNRAPKLAFRHDESLQFFQCRFGLAFEAWIYPDENTRVWAFASELSWIGVSTDALEGCSMKADRLEGSSCWRVERDFFSHIALVSSPRFGNCRAWRGDRTIPGTNQMMRLLNAQWLEGQAEARRAIKRTSMTAATSRRISNSTKILADLDMLRRAANRVHSEAPRMIIGLPGDRMESYRRKLFGRA